MAFGKRFRSSLKKKLFDVSGDTVKEISPKKAPGNITHLVKKRKKSEEEAANTENGSPKKPHLETNGTNGSSASTSNGH